MDIIPTDQADHQHLAIFRLPPVISIDTCATLQQQLQHVLSEHAAVTLDGSDVAFITTPGIQLLIATQKTLTAQDRALALQSCSSVLQDALRLSGLSVTMEHGGAHHA